MHPLTIWFSNHGNATRLAVIFAFGMGLIPAISLGQNSIEAAELAKRRAMFEEARVLLDKGDEAMGKQQPDLAFEAYAGARELLPDVPVLKENRELITERFVIAALSHAAALANKGDLKGANDMVDRVLDKTVAPKDPSALRMKQMLNDPVRNNPAITPEHVEDVQKVEALILKASSAVALGRFDFAARCYEDILLIDSYNVLARRGLMEVLRLKGESKIAAFDHTRANMLLEVDKQWELEVRKPEDEVVLPELLPDLEDLAAASVDAKLRQIMIRQVALDDVNLTDAVEYLRVTSLREDLIAANQENRGINFNINLGPEDSEVAQEIVKKRFDLKLQNVPILQVLKYITEMTGTAYRVDPYAVTIIPRSQVSAETYMRRYPVPAEFISALSEDGGGAGNDADPFAVAQPGQGLLTELLPVQELLKRKGVSFGEGASATYNAGANTLLLVNTAANHNIVEQIIDIIKGQDPVVISVQVTMIKTEQRNLEELGFDWMLNSYDLNNNGRVTLGGGTVGNGAGRTVSDFSNQFAMGGADDVAPNVITNGLRSGDFASVTNSIDSIINNPSRASQLTRVAPGILSLSGVFSDGSGQVIMRGLSQKKGIDVMARPSIITRNGESAKILLAREFIYPTEYDPPELQQGGGGNNGGNNGGGNAGPAFPVVPANPTAFETRNVGISLEVLALADANNRYVNVTLNPEIVEFEGFVNYGSPITVPVTDLLGNPTRVELTRNEILMPVFSTRRTTNQLTVADGATVVYGGLLSQNIQSIEDKVPILGDIPVIGRMFQSKSHQPISTAIVFMVKVDLMDPTGRPYRELGAAP